MSYNIIPGREYKFSTGIYFIDSDSKDYSFVFNNYKVNNLILHIRRNKMLKKFFKKEEEDKTRYLGGHRLRIRRGEYTAFITSNAILADGEPVLVKENGRYIGFKIGEDHGIDIDGIRYKASYFNNLPLYKFSTISIDDMIDKND